MRFRGSPKPKPYAKPLPSHLLLVSINPPPLNNLSPPLSSPRPQRPCTARVQFLELQTDKRAQRGSELWGSLTIQSVSGPNGSRAVARGDREGCEPRRHHSSE
jgi:hypothetical protein